MTELSAAAVPQGRSLPRVLVLSLFALSLVALSGAQAFDAAATGSSARLLLAVLPAWLAAASLYVLGSEARLRARASATDPLTGLARREDALRMIESELESTDRQPLAVVAFEIDRFDVFRASNGAAVANGLLRAFGRILRQHTRRVNVSARVSEHRFLAVLRGAALEDAWTFAEHVQNDFRRAGATAALPTLSVGIASAQLGRDGRESLVEQAGSAVDKARLEGGDRIHADGERRTVRGPTTSPMDPPAGQGERILVVEDDRAVRAIARRILKNAGYEVITAANGREAVDLMDGGVASIDLVLTDVVMPELGGRELADHVAMESPDTRVLLMSGYTDDLAVIHSIRAGVIPFLAKPFTPERLLSAVRRALDS